MTLELRRLGFNGDGLQAGDGADEHTDGDAPGRVLPVKYQQRR